VRNHLAEGGRAMAESLDRLRLRLYFRYLIEEGARDRWGDDWEQDHPDAPEWAQGTLRRERVEEECAVIQEAGYEAAFIMLYEMLAFCRQEGIPYGPGRGSVGGCLVAYCLGIHDVDSLEWDLLFERFMNPDRVSFPDVDIDISQVHRQKVIDFVRRRFTRDGQVVLRIGAFSRASGRAVVDAMLAAHAQDDPNAGATATNLKKCFPQKGTISGGVKTQRELRYWLDGNGGHGDREQFKAIAEQAGWLETMLKLDGHNTHLGKHAAGVVILREEDLPFLPLTSTYNKDTKGRDISTAYDMYALDDLGYPKWDLLGLRTLDYVVDAHRFNGGSGNMRELLRIWQEHRDDPGPYALIGGNEDGDVDTTGVFQMDTPGFQKTLRDFRPTRFEHLVQLCALYRPGALDYVVDGRNMVEIFIDRHHGREMATYDHPDLRPILGETHGVILYQEQAMKIVRVLGGFTRGQADSLRKAIGKKRPKELAKLKPMFVEGCKARGIQEAVIERIFSNIEAAGRYSWNKSHAVEYAVITWWTLWFKWATPAAFYAALINSLVDNRDAQASTVSVARQHAEFRPPDINVASDGFLVEDGEVVFGLSGIKGLGDENRNAILIDRLVYGPFADYVDFCRRLPSVPTNIKKSLIACGAFDRLGEDRVRLLASIPKGNPAWWTHLTCGCTTRKQTELPLLQVIRCSTHKADATVTQVTPIERKSQLVLEYVNDEAKRLAEGKEFRPPPEDLSLYAFPSDVDIAQGEMDAMGYYITATPLAKVTKDLGRMPTSYVGGEVHSVRAKDDKNGNAMGHIQLTTPDLTRRRVLVFASNWPQVGPFVEKGKQLIFAGRKDGDVYLADRAWEPEDYRHFNKAKLTGPGLQLDGQSVPIPPTLGRADRLALVRGYEEQGYRVRLQ
jgi:DNA polymerase-3 subunit alpha